MSDPAGDGPDAALQQLFAHLKSKKTHGSPRSETSGLQFSMASPTPSRSATNPMQSPPSATDAQQALLNISSAGIASPSSQSASLLNLLKFNTGAPSQNAPSQSPTPSRTSLPLLQHAGNQAHVRGVSTSDLVGSSMGRPHENANTPSPPTDTGAASFVGLSNPQDQLLQLLTRQGGTPARSPAVAPQAPSPLLGPSPAPAVHAAVDAASASASRSNRDSPIRVFGSRESREPTPFEPQDLNSTKPAEKPIFTYSNPFEQLAAFSPRNGTPGATTNENGTAPHPPPQSHQRVVQSIEVPSPDLTGADRTRVEALMGIGAPTTDAGIVSEAVDNVTDHLDKRGAQQDSEAQPSAHTSKRAKQGPSAQTEVSGAYGKVSDRKTKKEEEEQGLRDALEKLTTDDADEATLMEEIDAPADDEDSSTNEGDHQEVPVYNIPLKPFAAIQLIQPELPSLTFRDKSETDIARLKKEFDQIDRNLATASSDFIVYATAKKPFGVRVISQDDGADRQLFKENDSIFNVSLSSSPVGKTQETEHETFIATGQSGTVYWAVIRRSGRDTTQDEDIEKQCLVFPPSPAQDDNTSGGQLKTRAKKSNRHPEFFAIGRGKNIQIIFPFHALASKFVKKSVVDTNGYFKERSLKINTGKAGKDFTFSEDDSVLASLDKAGRLRFWDIRDIVDENNGTASKVAPIEVNVPIMTVSTAHVSDKAWPTSVLFVDKVRPYVRGSALRYVIVGMKQNHTLQLWDLGLGKVVQELNLPHDNESDAICSVAYHPSTGIIVVAHPTRNSIYFIHLSAPRYNLQGISQAKYLHAIVSKNPSLPKPDSTAIMSGIREYSFGASRQIRSLDLLPSQGALSDKKIEGDKGQFELYVMHSKGVACLNIKKADLGWTADNKVIRKLDAEEAGIVVVKELQELRPLADSELSSVNGDTKAQSIRARSPLPELVSSREKDSLATEPPINGLASSASKATSHKRKSKKVEPAPEEAFDDIPPPAPAPPVAAYTPSRNHNKSTTPHAPSARKEPKTPKMEPAESVDVGRVQVPSAEPPAPANVSVEFIEKEYKRIESGLKMAFDAALGAELEKIRKRIDDDRRALEASGAAKQDAILRLVSTSLTENVDKALDKIVLANIQKLVVPAINQTTEKALKKSIPEWLTKNLHEVVVAQLKQSLPEALNAAMSNAQVLQALSEGVTGKISKRIDKEIQSTYIPQFQGMAVQAATNLAHETERRVAEQLTRADLKAATQARNDADKIDKLTLLSEDLLDTVRTMAESQGAMRSEIIALQEQVQQLRAEPLPAPIAKTEPLPETSTDPELDAIVALMNEGQLEEGTIQWLQSPNQAALFDNFFVKIDPSYLQNLPHLVTLTVGAAVIQSLDKNLVERLNWLGSVLSLVDPQDPEVKAVAAQIMDVVVSRLESRYMSLAEVDPSDFRLRQIPPLTKAAKELKVLASGAA